MGMADGAAVADYLVCLAAFGIIVLVMLFARAQDRRNGAPARDAVAFGHFVSPVQQTEHRTPSPDAAL